LVFMIQMSIATLLGTRATRGVLFPLFYLVFLIPFGEELVPLLQTVTAKICIGLLKFSGIPAHIDGVFITTPNGYFEVAEACSGVKFLVAMIAYGTLVANVCFKSWMRRVLFMLLAIIVPILANGVRAFGTIYIGWLTDTNFAASFDHVVYGWFFFALVMGITMLIAWKFFDRKVDDPWIDDRVVAGRAERPSVAEGVNPLIAAGLALVAVFVPVGWQAAIAASGQIPVPHQIAMPEIAGWQRVPMVSRQPWTPRFDGADHRLIGRYANAQGDKVDLALVLYGWQTSDRKIIGFNRGAVDLDSRWAWTANVAAPVNAKAERILAPGPVGRTVVSFYVLGDQVMANPARIKLATLKQHLFGGDQAAVAILVSVEEEKGRSARSTIDAFLTDVGPVDRVAAQLVAQARGK
jgi:EpsI family protein